MSGCYFIMGLTNDGKGEPLMWSNPEWSYNPTYCLPERMHCSWGKNRLKFLMGCSAEWVVLGLRSTDERDAAIRGVGSRWCPVDWYAVWYGWHVNKGFASTMRREKVQTDEKKRWKRQGRKENEDSADVWYCWYVKVTEVMERKQGGKEALVRVVGGPREKNLRFPQKTSSGTKNK